MISSGKFPLLSDISNNTDNIDSDELHLRIIEDIKSGKFETCLEALASYAQKNDNYEDFARLISPFLRAIIHKEAADRMLLNEKREMSIEDIFFK